jgi:uncharacterized protein YndB with AHSA1/START domain
MRFLNQNGRRLREGNNMDASNKRKATNASFEKERVYQAPLDRVWKAWSEKDQLAKWWGPKGCSLEVLLLEFREGGFFHYAMRFENAPPMWGRFNYREIAPNERIVWLNSFANEKCGIARAPFSDLCPLEIENSVAFAEKEGTTTMTLHAEPFGASAEEVKYFAQLCSSGSPRARILRHVRSA